MQSNSRSNPAPITLIAALVIASTAGIAPTARADRSGYAGAVAVRSVADNDAAYWCEAEVRNWGLRQYGYSALKRVASDAGSPLRVIPGAISPNVRQRVVAQCFSNPLLIGSSTTEVGAWSTDLGGDVSVTSLCPYLRPYVGHVRCQIDSPEPSHTYLASACGDGIASIGRASVVRQLTGEVAEPNFSTQWGTATVPFQQTSGWNVGGTDLGFSYYADGKLYYAFGDTFAREGMAASDFQGHNAVAISSDFDPTDGIDFDAFIDDGAGGARQVLQEQGAECSRIPSGGFSITDDGGNTRHYLTYMAVESWWKDRNATCPGPQCTCNEVQGYDGELHTSSSGIAYSGANGTIDQTWSASGGPGWGRDSKFRTVSAYHDDLEGWIWLFGHNWIDDGLYVARVRATHADIVNPNAYQYWVLGAWLPGAAFAELATSVLPPDPNRRVREGSLVWNAYANRYMFMFLNAGANLGIELWQSTSPFGPWTLVDANNQLGPLDLTQAFYAPLTNDRLLVDQGREVHFLMSEWHPFDKNDRDQRYNVFQFKFQVNRNAVPGCTDIPVGF